MTNAPRRPLTYEAARVVSRNIDAGWDDTTLAEAHTILTIAPMMEMVEPGPVSERHRPAPPRQAIPGGSGTCDSRDQRWSTVMQNITNVMFWIGFIAFVIAVIAASSWLENPLPLFVVPAACGLIAWSEQ